jgi:hypothetical protein
LVCALLLVFSFYKLWIENNNAAIIIAINVGIAIVMILSFGFMLVVLG